jgi:hypothetical protein
MIDPKWFTDWEEHFGVKLPAKGSPILCRLANGAMIAGTVSLVFLAEDTPCVKVKTEEKTWPVFFEFGDRWTTEVPE